MFVPNKLVAAPKYIPSQFEIIKLSRDQNLYYYYVYEYDATAASLLVEEKTIAHNFANYSKAPGEISATILLE